MRTPDELQLFAQLNANYPKLREWLEKERAKNLKFLAHSDRTFPLARAQGIHSVLEEMIELLASAHKHLR